VKLSYIGDGNNVANSLLLGAGLLGMNISVACPKGFMPEKDSVARAKEWPPLPAFRRNHAGHRQGGERSALHLHRRMGEHGQGER
jgi:hypothetical protein